MKSMRLAFGVVLSALLLAGGLFSAHAVLSSGAPSGQAGAHTFLVATDDFGSQISAYRLVEGIPREVPVSPVATDLGPLFFGVDTGAQRLYVGAAGNTGGFVISGYHFTGSDGFSLTPLPGSPYGSASLSLPFGIAVDSGNHLLYVANSSGPGGTTISGFRINESNGALTGLPGSPFAAGAQPIGLVLDAADGFLYASNSGSKNVSGYHVDASTGNLTPVPGSPFPSSGDPSMAAIDVAHHLLYVTTDIGRQLWVYKIMPTGALALAKGSPVATELLFGIALGRHGNVVYAASYASNNVVGYRVDTETGELTPVAGSPFATGAFPIDVALDPTGQFVYVSNRSDSTISGFRVGSSGELTPLHGSPYAAGNGAYGLATVTIPQ